MILYLDTSVLVKLFIAEAGTSATHALVAAAAAVATSTVAYAEARAAFARRQREDALTIADLQSVVVALDAQWERYAVVDATMAIAREAGGLAQLHALRGFDAIHLASALAVHARAPGQVTFCSADTHLNAAAASEAMPVATI